MPSPAIHKANEGITSTDAATWRLRRAESKHTSTKQTERWRVRRPHKKQNAFANYAPPAKAFECVVRLRWCLRWARGYPQPQIHNIASGSVSPNL